MKVISEAHLRSLFRTASPESFTLREGQVITPAAIQYLRDQRIPLHREAGTPAEPMAAARSGRSLAGRAREKACRFRREADGGCMTDKPEHMTQLHGDTLVTKDHPRIVLRGLLDRLQAGILLLRKKAGKSKLADDLAEVLSQARQIMQAEVLEQPQAAPVYMGFSTAELRERSHHPRKYYDIGHILPEAEMDRLLLELNLLRTEVRQVEIQAVAAFADGSGCRRPDLIEALNRMSSAVYLMMVKWQAGDYR
jgi:ethanolamine utilization cobalamin adenosyltransferase